MLKTNHFAFIIASLSTILCATSYASSYMYQINGAVGNTCGSGCTIFVASGKVPLTSHLATSLCKGVTFNNVSNDANTKNAVITYTLPSDGLRIISMQNQQFLGCKLKIKLTYNQKNVFGSYKFKTYVLTLPNETINYWLSASSQENDHYRGYLNLKGAMGSSLSNGQTSVGIYSAHTASMAYQDVEGTGEYEGWAYDTLNGGFNENTHSLVNSGDRPVLQFNK